MTQPTRPRTIRLTEQELEAIVERAVSKLEARISSLEMALKSGQGVLIGAAAVIGFFLADGISRLKTLLGIAA
ncbi:MAG: hypothetical protein CFE27_14920 [Alphaproteobacteria bacterium PA1]|nr:MAG: hypothetical protein CFE27_14920 [Alphaproteobacteria bacterium PA1]